jgi:hypothetical protein
MPGAMYNDLGIQRKVIRAVLDSLGLDVWRAVDSEESVVLLPHLEHAKRTVLPSAHIGTIRRWFNHYVEFGDIPAEARRQRYNKHAKKGKPSCRRVR